MLSTLSLVRREFAAYFISPIAYVLLTVFLAATGYLFYRTLGELTTVGPYGVEFPMQMMLGLGDLRTLKGVLAFQAFWVVFLIIPPLLTMRLFAEERQSGTLEMLLTAPLRDWQIVLSKFLAAYGLYAALWLPTLAYLPALLDMTATVEPVWTAWSITLVSGLGALALGTLGAVLPGEAVPRWLVLFLWLAGAVATGVGAWGHYTQDTEHLLVVATGIDPNPVLSTYAGLALVGAMFLALGLFVSSLVRNPIVAALVALTLNMAFVVAGFWLVDMDPGSPLYQILAYVTVPLHFERNFTRGLIDTRQLVLYGSVTLFFLFLTVRSLEVRR
jgi:ABC-type transport system involved in multi-copper enzyme maturation permease subunit